MNKCPICNEQLEREIENGDNFIVHEEYIKCLSGHYSYEYQYGFTVIRIGNKDFDYSYFTPLKEIQLILEQVGLETERQKSLTKLK